MNASGRDDPSLKEQPSTLNTSRRPKRPWSKTNAENKVPKPEKYHAGRAPERGPKPPFFQEVSEKLDYPMFRHDLLI